MLDPLLNLIFPVDCVLCKGRVTQWRSGAVCRSCEALLLTQEPPFCEKCGLPAPAIEGLCERCLTRRTRYDFGRAALVFDDALRQLVHHCKYNDRVSLARPFSRALRNCLERYGFVADSVVPVPLHWKQERHRGYNQAELLASRLDLPLKRNIVRRRRETES